MNTHKTIVADSINLSERKTAGISALSRIKVTIHVPQDVPENIRCQKINRIYDILNPETSQ